MENTPDRNVGLPEAKGWRSPPNFAGVAMATLLVAAAVLAAYLLHPNLPASSIPLVLLLAVLVASVRHGFWVGIFASVLAFLAGNFFFVEPRFTFFVHDLADWLTLGVLLAAGATTGFLVGRLREERDTATLRARTLAALAKLTSDLSRAATPENVRTALVDNLAGLDRGQAVALNGDGGELKLTAKSDERVTLDYEDEVAAAQALRRGTADPVAPGWTGGRFAFRLLRNSATVIGFTERQAERPEIENTRHAMLEQAGLALEKLELETEARAAEAKAQREALRSALLTSLSHDLRTPLATILGGVSSLRELGDAMSPEARSDTLLAVEQEADRLARYVANLLHMTRLTTGLNLRAEWIDPSDTVRTAVERASGAYPDRRVEITLPAIIPVIHCDPVLLEQALFNVIDNAITASPTSFPVSVSLRVQEGLVSICVEDRGPGIAKEEQVHIFEPFFRGSQSGWEGSGLGLAIARGIMDAIGGTITVESPWDGLPGTRMTLSVPERSEKGGGPRDSDH